MLRRLRFFPVCGRKREWPWSQFSDMVLVSRRPGDDAWRFRESYPGGSSSGSESLARVVGKADRVQRTNAATSGSRCGRFVRSGRSTGQQKKPRQKAGAQPATALEGSVLHCFGSFLRSMGIGSDRFRFKFAAVELSHDIGANRPRRDLHHSRVLALAVGTLVGRAD